MSNVTSLYGWKLSREARAKNREADRKAQLIIDHMKEISAAYKARGMELELQSRAKLVTKLVLASDTKGGANV